jgi:hypothetical protein
MSKKNRLRAVDDRARLETQARRAQARAVEQGIAETLGLEARRGAEFAAEDDGEGGTRERPYRRQPGLDWLARKGRISEAQKAAGLRYRDAFVVAQPTQSLPSTLEMQPGMSAGGPSLKALVARADFRQQAERKLALYRRQLFQHPALVAACDLICGRELTPREAGGGDREALRLEAVLLVALDLLADA